MYYYPTKLWTKYHPNYLCEWLIPRRSPLAFGWSMLFIGATSPRFLAIYLYRPLSDTAGASPIMHLIFDKINANHRQSATFELILALDTLKCKKTSTYFSIMTIHQLYELSGINYVHLENGMSSNDTKPRPITLLKLKSCFIFIHIFRQY